MIRKDHNPQGLDDYRLIQQLVQQDAKRFNRTCGVGGSGYAVVQFNAPAGFGNSH
jgi:hypothetical protein